MPVTIRDIAKKLGLSIGAVSRALDGYADISEETRQRVIRAAREMDYVPNQAARQLRRKKSDSLGYILPSNSPRFADPFFSEFIAGLGDEIAHHPYDLVISIAPPGEEAEKHLYQNWVQGRKVDGVILTHVHLHDWRVQYLSEQRIPFTALGNTLDGYDFARVEVNWRAGIMELMAHLLANGYRRIAYLGGPATMTIQADQFNGYRQGLHEANIPYDDHLVMPGDLTSTGGYDATKRILCLPNPPDAIICINDETAFGVLRAAHEMGYVIGQSLAVAGFDGVEDAKYMEPPLTTLDISIYEIARQLARMLVGEINHIASGEHLIEIQPELVIRESTVGMQPSGIR
jgi:LacI family transcriptional regulator